MSGFRTPEVPREQLVLWKHRLEDAIPSDHPVRHLDYLLRSGVFAPPQIALRGPTACPEPEQRTDSRDPTRRIYKTTSPDQAAE